jgi:Ca-activated chloride channel family protein
MRSAGVLIAVILSAKGALAQGVPAPQPPVFAIQVESVLIDAFATNGGKSIAGLKARDFILRDNGVPQSFDLVSAESLPIRAVLVFDTSSSMKGPKLERLRSAAQSFLERLRPQDEVALISFSDEIDLRAPLSNDRARAEFGLLTLRARGSTSVYDALFAALVTPRSALRTLVILFSDGEDNMSWIGEKEARGMVERSNALIHVVAARSEDFESGVFRASRPPDTSYVKTLRSFATITGGSMIEVTSADSIAAAFAQIVQQMKDRYVLRYTPDVDPAPGWHALDLELRSGKGKVRGRTGYWVEAR